MSVRVIRKSLLSVVTVTLPAEKKLMLHIYAKRMKSNSRISSLCSHSFLDKNKIHILERHQCQNEKDSENYSSLKLHF